MIYIGKNNIEEFFSERYFFLDILMNAIALAAVLKVYIFLRDLMREKYRV